MIPSVEKTFGIEVSNDLVRAITPVLAAVYPATSRSLVVNPAMEEIFTILPPLPPCNQRFVSSIGKIEKAVWVFNCLGRSG